MKVREGFVVREVAGSIVAVATGDAAKNFNGMITLNETGRLLFERLTQGTTEHELVSALCDEFAVSKDIAKNSVRSFVEKLKEAGVVE